MKKLQIIEMALEGIVSEVYELDDIEEVKTGFFGLMANNENDRFSESIYFIVDKDEKMIDKFSSLDTDYEEKRKKYFK